MIKCMFSVLVFVTKILNQRFKGVLSTTSTGAMDHRFRKRKSAVWLLGRRCNRLWEIRLFVQMTGHLKLNTSGRLGGNLDVSSGMTKEDE